MEAGKAGDPGRGQWRGGKVPKAQFPSRTPESRAQDDQAADFLSPTCVTLFLLRGSPQLFLYFLQPLLKVPSLEKPSQTTT